ncbi:MAG: C40 family peptidase [Chitinophagales bacterium]
MFLRRTIFVFIFCCSAEIGFAQINPWWLNDTIVDSNEIKAELISDSVINFAKSFLGVPYVWGGMNPDSGFDCSGFICFVYSKFGIELPRTSGQQFDAGIPVPFNEARPGDLILFTGHEAEGGYPGHIGIVLSYDSGNGFTFIHASSPESGGVRISNEYDEKYYYKRFLEIRRVIL